MISNYLIFFSFYFLIILSVLGHGYLGIKLCKIKILEEEIGFIGLIGSFFNCLFIHHFLLV